jgi:hydroxyacylglutathione hydrolase
MKAMKNWLSGALLSVFVVYCPALSRTDVTDHPDKDLAQALKKFKSTLSSFEKGRGLFSQGDMAGAVRCFQNCTQSLPAHIYAHYYLANIHYVQQDYPGALRAIEKAEGSIDFMVALDAFAQKEKIKEFGKVKKAIEDYFDSINSCRESRELEQMYGRVEDEEKKTEMQATRDELRWRKLRSQYAYFHGNILFQLKDYDPAAERYRKALQEDSQNGNAYNNLAAIQFLARRFEEAERLLREAEDAGVDDMINLKLKKLVLEALGKSTEGILEQEYTAGSDDRIQAVRFTGNVYEGEPNRLHLFAHCYIVFDRDSRDALLIDPGRVDPRIETYVREKSLNIRIILNSHGHYDHTHANVHYAALFGVQIAAHEQEASLYAEDPDGQCGQPDILLDEQVVQYGTIPLQVHHTPGHTPGSACFQIGPFLISGDSLFADSIGRMSATDDSDYQKKRERLISILTHLVRTLSPEAQILPGHGQSCTAARAREINSALRRN